MKIEFDNMTVEFKQSEDTWVDHLEEFLRSLNAHGYICPRSVEELIDYYTGTQEED